MPAETISTKARVFGTSLSVRHAHVAGHVVATICVVAVLLIAASLKIHSWLVASPDHPSSLPLVVALGEILLGIVLLVPRARNLGWLAAGCLFASFAAFNTYQTLAGITDCGCFGDLNPSQSTVLVLDIFVLAALTGCPPSRNTRKNPLCHAARPFFDYRKVRSIGAVVITLLLVVNFATYVRKWLPSNDIDIRSPGVTVQGTSIRLEPEKWVGHPVALEGLVASPLPTGVHSTKLLILSSDCEKCRRALRSIETVSLLSLQPVTVMLVGFSSEELTLQIRETTTVIQFRDDLTVFCRVPCVIDISDGIVKDVAFPDA